MFILSTSWCRKSAGSTLNGTPCLGSAARAHQRAHRAQLSWSFLPLRRGSSQVWSADLIGGGRDLTGARRGGVRRGAGGVGLGQELEHAVYRRSACATANQGNLATFAAT